MRNLTLILASLAAASPAVLAAQGAAAQDVQVTRPAPGVTRLDVNVTGSAVRVPDIAIISAGVETRSTTAQGAIAANRKQMQSVVQALKKAGVADRDIRTSTISLHADYEYAERQSPRLTGYRASNMVTIRFRDIATSGAILDALVAAGANQINGPNLDIDDREAALDEARLDALKQGRERARLYAQALGLSNVSLVMVSEGGGSNVPPMPMMRAESMDAGGPPTQILPGEQDITFNLQMSFDLR